MSDEVLKLIKDKEVQYVDLRSTISAARCSTSLRRVDDRQDIFTEGTNVRRLVHLRWKAINESDMVMRLTRRARTSSVSISKPRWRCSATS